MKRALFLMLMTPVILLVPGTAAFAGPAVDVPSQACDNPGHEVAWAMSSENSNVPSPAHGHHTSCHVHLP